MIFILSNEILFKVTHVVFGDGYRKTYNKAIERNIPLVSVKWIEDCKLANKILDPVDYPPVNIVKYLTPKPKLKISVSLKFLLLQYLIGKYDFLLIRFYVKIFL